MRSLRGRFLAGTTVLISTVLALAAIVIFTRIESALYDNFDAVLLEKARALAAMTELGPEGIELDFADTDFKEFSRRENPEYFQLWLPDGKALERSESLRESDQRLVRSEPRPDRPEFETVRLPDGRRGRQLWYAFFPKLDDQLARGGDRDEQEERMKQPVVVSVAASTVDITSLLRTLRQMIVAVFVVSLALGIGLALIVVRQSLRPLRRISREIENFDERALDKRIDTDRVPR